MGALRILEIPHHEDAGAGDQEDGDRAPRTLILVHDRSASELAETLCWLNSEFVAHAGF